MVIKNIIYFYIVIKLQIHGRLPFLIIFLKNNSYNNSLNKFYPIYSKKYRLLLLNDLRKIILLIFRVGVKLKFNLIKSKN